MQPASIFNGWRPAWWGRVNPGNLRRDLIAGLLGAVLVLPQGVAFATLAGLPPQYGIYSAVVPCIVAALFGSSWHVMSGPTNANSLALFAMLSPLALSGSGQFIQLALAVTVLVGVMQLAIGACKLGSVADFISPSVMLGFTSGAAVLIALFALKDLFGLQVPAGTSALGVVHHLVAQAATINWYAALVGIVTILATLAARRFAPALPHMLLGVLSGYGTAWWLNHAAGHGVARVAVVGTIPSALPAFGIPHVSWAVLPDLAGIAAALTIVALGQSIAIAKAVAMRSGQQIDANREFVGQGLSNIVGGFFSAYVSCGSLNRSMPNFEAGAQTPLASVSSALLLVVLVAASAPLLAQIPLAAIGGMLMLVAWGLLDFSRMRRIFRVSRVEFAIVLATLVATILIRLEIAVLLGTVLSLVTYLYGASRPPIRPMVPDAEDAARAFTPLDELPQSQPECPQLKLVRVEGALYFGAVAHVASRLQAFRTDSPSQKHLLAMVKSMNSIDMAAADMWEDEMKKRRDEGGGLYFHRPRRQVMEMWKRTGFIDRVGPDNLFPSKASAIGAIYERLDPAICSGCQIRLFKECGRSGSELRLQSGETHHANS
ncbi:SulP family inorganic anion transporter [Massilia horti]|uniref:SulP family inorganic anion transporter n=1 Tax=Massilia horti TaxID=2562153 RepID=A0A4Y9T1N2_9BURK|nr:SulP family inorganic anion transporter [Massilia horti]TFW32897.1 SulP family inorganic anion transporter [Massilia horti]